MSFPIVGADFLQVFDLLIDLAKLRLIARNGRWWHLKATPTGSSAAALGIRAATAGPQHLNSIGSSPTALPLRLSSIGSTSSDQYQQLLWADPAVLNPSKKLPAVKHSVEHFIETSGRPVSGKYRRLDGEKLAAAREEFLELESQGIVRRSSSSWASPLHMVRKADGSWRPCGDFRRLNLQTRPDLYTCPNIADLTARLAGCCVFSKLDLRKGYHQVPVRTADIPKTAIITPFGLFEYLRMPFGLRNAGQTFQRMMDCVLTGLPFCFVYLDDILVASVDHQQHHQHLQQVLERLAEHGLVLNAEKCQLGLEQLDYLGHHVTATGITPIISRVQSIEKYPQPKTVKQLQTYLGMINFYRRFMPAAAKILRPLTDSLKGGVKGELQWTAEMKEAFSASKKCLCNCVELAHPEAAAQISLAVDASESHVGAVLQQHKADSNRPLAFFSTKLDAAQKKYSAYDRELLAIYLAIRHFRWLLEGRDFYVLSDHKPLTFALHRISDAWTARAQRQLSYIAEFTSDIRHIAGTENVVADALSRPAAALAAASTPSQSSSEDHLRSKQDRPPAAASQRAGSSSPSPGSSKDHLRSKQDRPPAAASATAAIALPTTARVDYAKIAAGQVNCAETLKLRSNSKMQIKHVKIDNVEVYCDLSTGVLRPLVPVAERKTIFTAIHGLAHPGVRATRRMLTSRFIWDGCAADVNAWCRDCQGCATGKVTTQERTAVEPIQLPAARFQHVHVDIVGPLPVSQEGYSYLLTAVDRTSRWPEVIPLKSISAEVVADAFARGWVARFGVPEKVTTDRGTQFVSTTWSCLCRTLGIEHITTTAYHPQSNGLVERFHRQLKEALKARACGAAWTDHLPWVLLGLRAAPKEDSGVSAGEAVYGAQLKIPGQLTGQDASQFKMAQPILLRERNYNREGPRSLLEEAEFVYVRRGAVGGPLTPSYSGPYKVLARHKKYLQLQIGHKTDWVSADRLKPHKGERPEAAMPPRRGRPPKK